MAADSPYAVESAGAEPTREAYVSPMADFLLVSLFVSIVAIAGVAVMIP